MTSQIHKRTKTVELDNSEKEKVIIGRSHFGIVNNTMAKKNFSFNLLDMYLLELQQ